MRKKLPVLFMTVTVLTALLVGCGKSESQEDGVVDPLDYVSITYDGANGEGTAWVEVDYDGMELEMVGGQDKLDELDSVDDLGTLTKYMNLCASISFDIDKNENLSNGDIVTVTVTYDESAAQTAGVNMGSEGSKEFKVSGLD